MNMVLQSVGSLATYFLYHVAFFAFVSHMFEKRPSPWAVYGAAFAVNYGIFFALTMLEVPLILNWTLIAALFALEVKVLYRRSWQSCLLLALLGACVGLSATIAMRAACALALDVPLAAFSNSYQTMNMKALPVSLGFLTAAIAWKGIDIPNNRRVLYVITMEPRAERFLVIEIALCYLYLCLNLLLFYSPLDSLLIKLWCLKTSVFVSMGSVLAIWFSYRLASVFVQTRRHEALLREIDADERLGAQLRQFADRDALTMCFTRSYAMRKLKKLLEAGERFTLVFADLDGLKAVNDEHGHSYGDAYIASAASALADLRATADDFVARYGGDEFLIILRSDVNETLLSERMSVMQRELLESAKDIQLPFKPSISWGSAKAQPGDSLESLIARADEAMYRRKHGGRPSAQQASAV